MKNQKQKTNWLVDAALFAGFLICFWLDLTGLMLHQWLGVAAGGIAFYHLLVHWNWLEAVTERLFGRTSGQARLYYLIDVALMLGFWLILVSGLLISTWLNLSLENYSAWVDLHITLSIVSLVLVAIKIGAHWRWIITVAKRSVFPPAAPKAGAPTAQPATVTVNASRRDLLKLMGLVSAAAVLSIAGIVNQGENTLSSESSTGQSTTGLTSQENLLQSNSDDSCVVRCNKSCSYPGRCNRYVDTNGNGRCDNGECV
jgi:hypothetical protein